MVIIDMSAVQQWGVIAHKSIEISKFTAISDKNLLLNIFELIDLATSLR